MRMSMGKHLNRQRLRRSRQSLQPIPAEPNSLSLSDYRKALELHRCGKFDDALKIYDQVLTNCPSHADTWHMLGMLHYQTGSAEKALDCLNRSVTLRPNHAEQYSNLGVIYRSLGRSSEAVASLQKALEFDPHHVNTHNNLGVVLLESNQLEAAEQHFRRVIERDHDNATALSNLGNLYQAQRRHNEAVDVQRQALAAAPDHVDAWNNLGCSLRALGRLPEARESLQRAVALNPQALQPVINLGRTLCELGDLTAAEQVLRAVCRVHPTSPAAHHYWGVSLDLLGQHNAAIDQFDIALGIDPVYVHCLCSKGLCLQRRGDLQTAIALLERALSLRPDLAETHSCYLSLVSNDVSRSPEWLFEQHRQWGGLHGRVVNRFEHRDHDRDPQRRLKIGYVSPDFRQHAVMQYLEPVLKHHNHDHVEIFAYAQVFVEDQVTLRAKTNVQHWRSTCGLSDEQLVDVMVADGIDILVDLAGHTANNRLRAFAYKPAPVQLTWLGYPHTTGLSTVDYFLTNRVQDPLHESYHVEKPIHLDVDTCFEPLDGGCDLTPLPAIRNGFITFGSLHRHQKISRESLDLWARVLVANPTARLVIFNTTLTNDAKEFLRRELVERGIEQQRFALQSQAPNAGYLKVYDDIDIALDVFPWSGGTTTREALWMGVPVIALYGDRRSARSTAAALTQVGIPEWIAYSVEEYVSLATKLANDIEVLTRLRATLRDSMRKTLCNAAEFTKTLEAIYRRVWQTWCRQPVQIQDGSESNAEQQIDCLPHQFSRSVL